MKRIIGFILALCLILSAAPFALAAQAPTEAEAYNAMIALQDTYPEGTPWAGDVFYEWNGGVYSGGYGCVAFAFILSDAAFGDLPARVVEDVSFEDVRVGDILRMNNDTHSVIVMEVYQDYVVLAEGSYNDSVHWGRILTVKDVEGSDYLMTRYPEGHSDEDSNPAASIIPADAVVVDSGDCGPNDQPNVKWTYCADGTLYLTGQGDTKDYMYPSPNWSSYMDSVKRVVVQDGITAIGSRTFSNHTALTEVVLPETIQIIDMEAFSSCSALEKITLPEGLKTIESRAFSYCTALTGLDFPKTVEKINVDAFKGSGLAEAILPEGLSYLGSGAFEDCASLKEIYIPGSVNNNIQNLVLGCDSLEKVRFGEGFTDIGRACFQDCASLKKVELPSTLVSIGDECFSSTGLEELVLPEGLQELGDKAFENCDQLTSVKIPASITSFGDDVFSYCDVLSDVTIADGLTELGNGTFSYCKQLQSVDLPDSLTRIGAYLFENSGLTSMEIPNGVTEIGPYAFGNLEYLRLLTIPSTVTKMGQCVVDRCDALPCVYFDGTQAQYDAIDFYQGNSIDQYISVVCVDQSGCSHTNSTKLEQIPVGCDSYGVTEGEICAACGKILKAPALILEYGHTWTGWVALDSYTERRQCQMCGAKEDRQIQPSETEPTEETTEPTEPETKPTEPETKPTEPAPTKNPFVDVKNGEYYYDPVLWAVGRNITNGMDATHFSPGATCTRGQIVTFLWRAQGEPEPTSTKNPFKDVKKDDFFYKAVLWAVEKGITNGTSETTFSPNDDCTRAQVATFLWRALGSTNPTSQSHSFKDLKKGEYYYNAVLWAVENGVTNGVSESSFAPNSPCTRGQIVTFLYRALN